MTNIELKDALINQSPVVFRSNRRGELRYKCVSAIRYIRGKGGEILIQAELMDYNDNSITIARAEEVFLDRGETDV